MNSKSQMIRISSVLILMMLTGCSILEPSVKRAENICKTRKGLKHLNTNGRYIAFECNDGFQYTGEL